MSFSVGKFFGANPSYRQRLKYTAGRGELSRNHPGRREEDI